MAGKKQGIKLFQRIKTSDRTFIARQLAVMLQSGLPITQAVRSLIEQTSNELVEQSLTEIVNDLENGYKFSDSVKKHPELFNQVFVAVIAAGEATGKIDEALAMLADEHERDQRFRGRFIGSLLYPAFIVGTMVIVGLLMVVKVIPALESVFKEANVDLPWTTELLVFIANSIMNYWWAYIAILAAAITLIVRWFDTEEGQHWLNTVVLGVPVLGGLVRNLEMARFTGIFSLMVAAGVPIIQAIESVAKVLDNDIYRKALGQVAKNVERGAPISQSLVRQEVFPATVTQMIAVGEQSGKLEEVLNRLSHYYEEETNQGIKNIAALTEPVVFVIVGLGVAFLVFSIIMPIYQLANVL